MGVGALIARSAESAGERTAVVFQNRRISYRHLIRRAYRVANALSGAGGRPGDRAALLLPNGPEFIEIYLGCALAGVVVVPLNPLLHLEELRTLIEHAEPAFVFCDAPWLRAFDEDGFSGSAMISVPDQYEQWLSLAKDTGRPSAVSDDAPAAIAYTSGTTGRPKGATISHGNIKASIFNGVVAFGLNAGLVNVLFQPFVFHPLFVGHVLGVLAVGGRINVLPEFDPGAYLDMVANERVNFLVHVPTTIRRVLEEQERRPRDLRSVHTLFTGGAPCTSGLIEHALQHVPRVIQGFGLTEATNIVACTTGTKPRSADHCGDTLPWCRLAILDGEILVQGEVVAQGYWRDDELTRRTFRDGWLHTGDLGVIDDLGQLRVTGRKKDVIISGGVQIHANEVEDVLSRCPSVAEAAVVGVPDEEWGEAVKAWIVLRPGHAPSATDIDEFCQRHLARYKRPRHVTFIEALPKNANGKVRKDLLTQRTEGG